MAQGESSTLARTDEFGRLREAFEARARYADVSSGVLQEFLEAGRALSTDT